jgi:nucleoside-diphosphate-sugar epimerase
MKPVVAVTGATGFIGRHLVLALAQAGWQVRLLLRREPVEPGWEELRPQVVAGSLSDAAALERLAVGAQVVVHLAGLIKAARRAQFLAVNRDGAVALARATQRVAPGAHFLMVSSLAAREPGLSDYAASKRAGEDAVRALLGAQATILRPPAVYGPGDRETLLFFQIARRRTVPLPGDPRARAALIHVADLVRLIVALVGAPPRAGILAAADDRPAGYSWRDVLGAAAAAVGNPAPRFVQAPVPLLAAIALAGDVGRVFGSANMLNSQKLRELRHLDWGVTEAERVLPDGWSPRFKLADGFADAVAWYRDAGWLPPAA